MKIPCVGRLDIVLSGLSFLVPILTRIQFENLTMFATALILGSRFKLTDFSLMWLKKKSVSAISEFFSDSKFSFYEMNATFAQRVQDIYPLYEGGGYFLIDDTMKHHTKLCKMIHGVFWLFDHAFGTSLKAICIVVLYYSDGQLIKFPIGFRIFYKNPDKRMPWQKNLEIKCKTKYELAIELIEEALKQGFPKSTVLADSWFGINPFIKELKRLKLSFVVEIKSNYMVKVSCQTPRRTPTGRVAKHQFDLITLGIFFKSLSNNTYVGFAYDPETEKQSKVLYKCKVATITLNAFFGKHRVVQSYDPTKKTIKYLLTNELHWEIKRIIFAYSCRWVIEEFFRNAKQLTDMEGACLRSEQGVALALYLVSWIDFLLHHEIYKNCAANKLSKGPLTVQSIIRRSQAKNAEAFIEKVKTDDEFLKRWVDSIQQDIYRKRKKHGKLVVLGEEQENSQKRAISGNIRATP